MSSFRVSLPPKLILAAVLLCAPALASLGQTQSTRTFDVRDFGAKGDGKSQDTPGIQQALDACGTAGGGIVRLPPGTYLSRPIHLRNKTTLYLDSGTKLQATDEPEDFADPRKPGSRLAFVNGNRLEQVAITGGGTIDGAGERWWAPVRAAKRAKQPYNEVPRRPRMVILSECRNVRIDGVTLQNSPSFHLVPSECENVLITNVTFRAPDDAPNTDAIDPSACRDVRIIGCTIDVGDDNIALKSGRKVAGHEAAVENVWVERCTFLHGHGMSVGSETLGGVKNLTVTNCTFNGTTSGIRIKSARGKGGLVEKLVYTDITMTNVEYPIYLTSYYPKVPKDDSARPMAPDSPVYRNIIIRNLVAHSPRAAGMIVGLPEAPIVRIKLENVQITAPTGLVVRNAEAVELKDSIVNAEHGASIILETNAVVRGLPAPVQGGGADARIRIVLVGDSTVTDHAGWGLGFKQFLNEKAVCTNTAQGGRSSKSFRNEGRWTNALTLRGNYYLIQFGHNNEPGKPGRSTDMPTFVSNMVSYVEEAQAVGATPVLVTPLTRRQWDKERPGRIKSSLAPYAEEVRNIAAQRNVPLIDLHVRSIELCESLGPEKCLEFSPLKTVNGTNTTAYDGTHLNPTGHVLFARLVVEELRKAVPELSAVLRTEPVDPNPVAREASFDAVVSADGSGTHTTVQAAIAAAPNGATKPFTILLKPGKYEGQIIVPRSKHNLWFVGEQPENTVLTYALNVYETNAATDLRFKGTGVVVQGDDFRAENITFENTSGDHGQALALRVDGDRAFFNNCRMLGWQDTLMINNGRQYFTNCCIEGRVDFIYGSATAVFDRCEIRSKNGGHVTAASTPKDQPFGFVFMNCKLTGDPKPWINPAGIPANPNSPPKADLGRPWRPYASVTYLNCDMGSHIKPEGWNNWRNPTNELTARFAEYSSTGPGANPQARFKWARQLTREEAKQFTVEEVLRGSDHWNPGSHSTR
jgi:pectinesterase